jgi:UDP-N-acetylmuramyl pentapeptide synthase
MLLHCVLSEIFSHHRVAKLLRSTTESKQQCHRCDNSYLTLFSAAAAAIVNFSHIPQPHCSIIATSSQSVAVLAKLYMIGFASVCTHSWALPVASWHNASNATAATAIATTATTGAVAAAASAIGCTRCSSAIQCDESTLVVNNCNEVVCCAAVH